jgi:hypothetical protein
MTASVSACLIEVGSRFGKLTVVARAASTKTVRPRWLCVCDCGRQTLTGSQNLRRGAAQSCGCKRFKHRSTPKENHGQSRAAGGKATREYMTWSSMLGRCHNQKHKQFGRYGGRGISVCPSWRNSYLSFLRDVGPKPVGPFSLERVDNNGDYAPGNVRWATWKEQASNRRNSRLLTFQGRTMTMKQWAEESGIGYTTLKERLMRGWTLERSLHQQVGT